MQQRKIIIDCDPGWDDIVNLCILAMNEERLKVEFAGTIFGNRHEEKTFSNLTAAVSAIGRHWPLYRGSSVPLSAAPPFDDAWTNGLQPELGQMIMDDVSSPAADSVSAMEALERTLLKFPGQITLIATGPLTNLANLLLQFPAAAELAQEVIVVGGTLEAGNVTPFAEYNFYLDAAAADLVLNAGWNVSVLLLEHCKAATLSHCDVEWFRSIPSKETALIADLATQYRDIGFAAGQAEPVCPYDLASALFLLAPELFVSTPCKLGVIVDGGDEHGRLVRRTGEGCNIIQPLEAFDLASALRRVIPNPARASH